MAFGFPLEYDDRHCISPFEYDPPAPNLRWGFFVEGFTITRLLQDIRHLVPVLPVLHRYGGGVRDFRM